VCVCVCVLFIGIYTLCLGSGDIDEVGLLIGIIYS